MAQPEHIKKKHEKEYLAAAIKNANSVVYLLGELAVYADNRRAGPVKVQLAKARELEASLNEIEQSLRREEI